MDVLELGVREMQAQRLIDVCQGLEAR